MRKSVAPLTPTDPDSIACNPSASLQAIHVSWQSWLQSIFVLLCICLLAVQAFADSDQDAIDAGKASLEANDCSHAVQFLESVSAKIRTDSDWMSLAARAHDCNGDSAVALDYYRNLPKEMRDQAATHKEIGRLMLIVQRTKEAAQKKKDEDAKNKALRANLTGQWRRGDWPGDVLLTVTEQNGQVIATFTNDVNANSDHGFYSAGEEKFHGTRDASGAIKGDTTFRYPDKQFGECYGPSCSENKWGKSYAESSTLEIADDGKSLIERGRNRDFQDCDCKLYKVESYADPWRRLQ